MKAHELTDSQYKLLLDAAALCKRIKVEHAYDHANEARIALERLVDQCIDSRDAVEPPPF